MVVNNEKRAMQAQKLFQYVHITPNKLNLDNYLEGEGHSKSAKKRHREQVKRLKQEPKTEPVSEDPISSEDH